MSTCGRSWGMMMLRIAILCIVLLRKFREFWWVRLYRKSTYTVKIQLSCRWILSNMYKGSKCQVSMLSTLKHSTNPIISNISSSIESTYTRIQHPTYTRISDKQIKISNSWSSSWKKLKMISSNLLLKRLRVTKIRLISSIKRKARRWVISNMRSLRTRKNTMKITLISRSYWLRMKIGISNKQKHRKKNMRKNSSSFINKPVNCEKLMPVYKNSKSGKKICIWSKTIKW